jgi:hypothetical protein
MSVVAAAAAFGAASIGWTVLILQQYKKRFFWVFALVAGKQADGSNLKPNQKIIYSLRRCVRS